MTDLIPISLAETIGAKAISVAINTA